jgi:Ca2+-binding EF-hand superfamily protein
MHLEKLIKLIFHVFDDERTGLLSPSTFMLLLRIVGLRVNLPDVLPWIQTAKRNRQKRRTHGDSHTLPPSSLQLDGIDEDNDLVDLALAMDIIKNQSAQIHSLDFNDLFLLVDPKDTGSISQNSLEQVITELYELENMQDNDDLGLFLLPTEITEDDVSAMIDEFDKDGDGKLKYDDFVQMMERSL